MKLKSTIALHASGETIRRDPGLWDRFKLAFGKKPNLDTARVRTHITTAHFVEGVKKGLERLGIHNAVALVIDGQVLFEDREGRDDDFGDLFLAFFKNEELVGRGFRTLQLAVEHVEDGLHHVIEIVGRGEHERDEATAHVLVSSRVVALELQPGEDQAAYNARVAPLLDTPAVCERHREAFAAFVARVSRGLDAALADVRVEAGDARALVERPGRDPRLQTSAPMLAAGPDDVAYDPYERYYATTYPAPAISFFWSALMRWSPAPPYAVIDRNGTETGTADDLADTMDIGNDVDSDLGDEPAWEGAWNPEGGGLANDDGWW
jgi:hypothetical protein